MTDGPESIRRLWRRSAPAHPAGHLRAQRHGYYDAYYNRALKIRRMIRDEYLKAFASCDVLLSPTTPSTAFELGGITDPVEMYLCDRYTVGANIAGIPGISIPFGKTSNLCRSGCSCSPRHLRMNRC